MRSYDNMLLLNNSKCISFINYVNMENIINFEYSENFQKFRVYVANFPNQKGSRAPSKNCQKNPWDTAKVLLSVTAKKLFFKSEEREV